MRAIEDGAPYAAYSARAEEIEAEIAAAKGRLVQAEQAATEILEPPPDIGGAYVKALERIDDLLGRPDLVNQAHELLAVLFEPIVVTPNELAADGLQAEIHWDFIRLLLASGRQKRTPNRLHSLAS